ncbi:hypothetical protein MTR_1g041870 [Medicago truncatula]|uniref:Uncharacterized protein n=1 Tax=Medicago truncatula TaxID=3880 RepID=G7I3P5_MEDTR|nr:hypothetical protein MTR_1g041870 [Medicago truncatula]
MEQMNHEIEPGFVKGNLANLSALWYLVNPLLTHGWTEFKDFNDLPENVEIVFGYYENNMFSVYMFKTIYTHDDLPTWHSRCTIINRTAYFDSLLTEDDFLSPMKQYDFVDVKLCVDNGNEEKFKVYFLNDAKLTTQFGIMWDQFCKNSNFRIDQTICFKLMISDKEKCHVYKVNPPATSSIASA